MLRHFQTSRLTRPARLRLSVNKRFIASKNGTKDAFAPSSLMRKLEAEDSNHAAQHAEEYKKQGVDVRGMCDPQQWLTIVPKSSGRLPSLMNRSSFGPSWRDRISSADAGPSGSSATAPQEPSRKGKEKATEPELGESCGLQSQELVKLTEQ